MGSIKYQQADSRYHAIQHYEDDEKKPLIATEEKSAFRKEVEIWVLMVVVIFFGSLNSVFKKIMTEPMGDYSFFLSLFNAFVYTVFYYAILYGRYFTGKVSKEDMNFPFTKMEVPPESTAKWWDRLPAVKYFIISGFMDGLGNVLGIIPTAHISGPMTSVMSQTIVFFSVVCAIVMLRTRYTIYQIGAVLVVVAGAVVSLVPEFQHHNTGNPIGWLILFAFSTLPNAISFTIKELVFRKKKNLEVFVVNSYGSLFQLLWWPVMIPITVLLNQTNGKPLAQYIHDGFQCFGGSTPEGVTPSCGPNPYPYLVYIGFNLAFNISLLVLLKRASALQGFMAIKAILPIAVILFLIKWPLIGASTIDIYTIISLVVILIGLGLFRYTTILKERAAAAQK